MTGWEFLEEYEKIALKQKRKELGIKLTTSLNPDHEQKALKITSIDIFCQKPLDL